MIHTAPLPLHEAAAALGIKPGTLSKWLAKSKRGTFWLHGQQVTIAHRQTGAKAQGKITIPAAEVERIQELLTVTSVAPPPPPVQRITQPRRHITVPLGRPD